MIRAVCLGDLFLECIRPFPEPQHPTWIVGSDEVVLGGNAYNICWNLAQLGICCALVAPFARRQSSLVKRSFLQRRQWRRIVWTTGDSDVLVAFVAPDRHHSVYLKGDVPLSTEDAMVRSARGFEWGIMAGSRHAEVRRAFVRLAQQGGPALVFTPSYTVFEYRRADLTMLLEKAAIVILNESEARYVANAVGASTRRALARRVKGTLIVTYADRGAVAYLQSGVHAIESVSNRTGNVVGAGDAFLAAYLHTLWTGASPERVLRFAAASAAAVANAGGVRVRLPVRAIATQVARHRWGVAKANRRPPG